MTIGIRFKIARLKAGLTQQELADKSFVDRRTIVRLEAAGNTSNSPMLDRIAATLGESPAYMRYGVSAREEDRHLP